MAEIKNGRELKAIAFYLPHFHEIPENDKAWGKGFTEWTNTKKAKPLFRGHYQPKTPFNENYYSLLNANTQIWQSELAEKYGVFGFCYYHYWFKNGKKLLEKPAENMIRDKRIKTPFCFSWANENWTKNWDGGNREIIVEQDYGSEKEWEAHFIYLLDFFKDERYITYDGKPVFIIYKPELIPNVKSMIEYLRRRAKEEGFPGLEIMIQFPAYAFSENLDENLYDHYICFEPLYTGRELARKKKWSEKYSIENVCRKIKEIIRNKFKSGSHCFYDYDFYWRNILKRSNYKGKFLRGAFVDWDNTARNKSGIVFAGATPQKFGKYMHKLATTIKQSGEDNIVFINAWNEWAGGAYLEPDEKYGYAYLEEIKKVVQDSNE